MQEIKSASAQDIEAVIELPGHRKKFEIAVKEARGEVCNWISLSHEHGVYYIGLTRYVQISSNAPKQNAGFDRLIFSRPPPSKLRAGQTAPMFQVQANPGADQEVEVVVHGGAHVSGTTRRRLLPNGTNPSIAFFDDIVVVPRTLSATSIRVPSCLFFVFDLNRAATCSPLCCFHRRLSPTQQLVNIGLRCAPSKIPMASTSKRHSQPQSVRYQWRDFSQTEIARC